MTSWICERKGTTERVGAAKRSRTWPSRPTYTASRSLRKSAIERGEGRKERDGKRKRERGETDVHVLPLDAPMILDRDTGPPLHRRRVSAS